MRTPLRKTLIGDILVSGICVKAEDHAVCRKREKYPRQLDLKGYELRRQYSDLDQSRRTRGAGVGPCPIGYSLRVLILDLVWTCCSQYAALQGYKEAPIEQLSR